MRKTLIQGLFLFICLVPYEIIGQNLKHSENKSWQISVIVGLEAHDKRLFNFTKDIKEYLLSSQPENFGSYIFRIGIEKEIVFSKEITHYPGFSLGLRTYTFNRPFDHCQFSDGLCDLILLTTHKYQVGTAELSWRSTFNLGSRLFIFGSVHAISDIMKRAKVPTNKRTFGPKINPDIYSFELFGGMGCSLSRLSIGIDYRLFNYKKIDEVIVPILFPKSNQAVVDPYLGKWDQWYNPFHLSFNIWYSI